MMTNDPDERLHLILTGREIVVPLSQADEHRLRMWIDRHNREAECFAGFTPDDLLDPDDDGDIGCALLCCTAAGLAEDEGDHGLEAFPWGDIVSVDVAEAIRRDRGMAA